MLEKIMKLLKREDPYLWRNRLATLKRNAAHSSEEDWGRTAKSLWGVESWEQLLELVSQEEKSFALKSAAEAKTKQAELEKAEAAAKEAVRKAQEDEARRNELAAGVKRLGFTIGNLQQAIASLEDNQIGLDAALAETYFEKHDRGTDAYGMARIESAVEQLVSFKVRQTALRDALKLAEARLASESAELEALK